MVVDGMLSMLFEAKKSSVTLRGIIKKEIHLHSYPPIIWLKNPVIKASAISQMVNIARRRKKSSCHNNEFIGSLMITYAFKLFIFRLINIY